eukprot:scaffold2046_cov171-Amphora_coffeaeformis.AAC.12
MIKAVMCTALDSQALTMNVTMAPRMSFDGMGRQRRVTSVNSIMKKRKRKNHPGSIFDEQSCMYLKGSSCKPQRSLAVYSRGKQRATTQLWPRDLVPILLGVSPANFSM